MMAPVIAMDPVVRKKVTAIPILTVWMVCSALGH